MNQCERYEMLVSTWLDGEFEGADRLELTDHLVYCAACREFYREARALDGLVAAVSPQVEPPPAEAWERIRAAAERETGGRRSLVPAWAMRLAAVLVLGIGAGFLLWNRGPAEVGAIASNARSSEIELRLGEDQGRMSEARFVELTTEVLRADSRYHLAMFEVMQQVVEDSRHAEAPMSELERSAEEDAEPESWRPASRDLV